MPVEVTLNQTQTAVVSEVLLRRSNVFVGGIAGTGKSEVIRAISSQSALRKDQIALLGPTGTAAGILGGSTVHSFFGIGKLPDAVDMKSLLGRVFGQAEVVKRLRAVELIVVDEVSMVTSTLLQAMKEVLEAVRGSQKPYGGVQMVLVGDMNQLPPVVPRKGANYQERVARAWAFAGEQWSSLNLKYFNLTEIVRSVDPVHQNLVRSIAVGRVSDTDRQILETRKAMKDSSDLVVINPKRRVVLCGTNAEVDYYNKLIIDNMTTKKDGTAKKKAVVHYCAVDRFDGNPTEIEKEELMQEANLAKNFFACKHARVMYRGPPKEVIAYNRSTKERKTIRVVNGMVGEIQDFAPNKDFVDDCIRTGRQGILGDFPGNSIQTALQVEFDGHEGFLVFVGEALETIEGPGFRLYRTQYAVVISFAMTIHKAQGQTFENVHVILREHFATGLFYVAVSRVKTLSNLTLDKHTDLSKPGIDRATCRNPDVEAFLQAVNKRNVEFLGKRKRGTSDTNEH